LPPGAVPRPPGAPGGRRAGGAAVDALGELAGADRTTAPSQVTPPPPAFEAELEVPGQATGPTTVDPAVAASIAGAMDVSAEEIKKDELMKQFRNAQARIIRVDHRLKEAIAAFHKGNSSIKVMDVFHLDEDLRQEIERGEGLFKEATGKDIDIHQSSDYPSLHREVMRMLKEARSKGEKK